MCGYKEANNRLRNPNKSGSGIQTGYAWIQRCKKVHLKPLKVPNQAMLGIQRVGYKPSLYP